MFYASTATLFGIHVQFERRKQGRSVGMNLCNRLRIILEFLSLHTHCMNIIALEAQQVSNGRLIRDSFFR